MGKCFQKKKDQCLGDGGGAVGDRRQGGVLNLKKPGGGQGGRKIWLTSRGGGKKGGGGRGSKGVSAVGIRKNPKKKLLPSFEKERNLGWSKTRLGGDGFRQGSENAEGRGEKTDQDGSKRELGFPIKSGKGDRSLWVWWGVRGWGEKRLLFVG